MPGLIVHRQETEIIAAAGNDEEVLDVCGGRILCIGTQYHLLVPPMNAILTFGKSLHVPGIPIARQRRSAAIVGALLAGPKNKLALYDFRSARRAKRDARTFEFCRPVAEVLRRERRHMRDE